MTSRARYTLGWPCVFLAKQDRFVVQGGRTPFEVLFDRRSFSPLEKHCLGKTTAKSKRKEEPWKKEIFVGKDHVSNAN